MTGSDETNAVRTGILSAVLAYTIWGFFPIYFILLRGVPADEILTHRILWAIPVGALIIGMRGQWAEVRRGLTSPKLVRTLLLSASIIALNWLIYIAAVQNERIFEASLGYYINPLIYVLVGVVVLGERLRQLQMMAVGLATVGVLVLTVYGGQFPAVSLLLAVSFTAYGYIRKQTDIGAMPGLFIETVMLAPIAALYLAWIISTRDTAAESADPAQWALLSFAGPATVVPLLFFAIAARRLTLATLGFLQFIGPTLQFVVGLIDGEAFTTAHQICFTLIWAAAGVFAYDAWRSRARASTSI